MNTILNTLPHRYPFLLVDRVVEAEPGKWARGYKNISYNEWFFEGHFPGKPIMPGVLIVEAIAQMSAFAVDEKKRTDATPVIAEIKDVSFKKPVQPGDRLDLYFEISSHRGPFLKGNGIASVNGETVAKITDFLGVGKQ